MNRAPCPYKPAELAQMWVECGTKPAMAEKLGIELYRLRHWLEVSGVYKHNGKPCVVYSHCPFCGKLVKLKTFCGTICERGFRDKQTDMRQRILARFGEYQRRHVERVSVSVMQNTHGENFVKLCNAILSGKLSVRGAKNC